MEQSKEPEKGEYFDERTLEPGNSDTSLSIPDEDDPRVKRILRKVDLRLCAILGLLYCVNQIDRVNLPNA